MRIMHKTQDEKLPTPSGWTREVVVVPVFMNRKGKMVAEERGLQVRMTGPVPEVWKELVTG